MVGGAEMVAETRVALGLEEGDFSEYLRALPTRNEMEAFVQRLEQGHQRVLQSVKWRCR